MHYSNAALKTRRGWRADGQKGLPRSKHEILFLCITILSNHLEMPVIFLCVSDTWETDFGFKHCPSNLRSFHYSQHPIF